MPPSPSDSAIDLPLLTAVERGQASPAAIEQEVMSLFDEWAPPLLRYVASFGLTSEEAEDVVQDVFLALFRHLRLQRSQRNLRAWLFKVAHNLALRHRRRNQRRLSRHGRLETDVAECADDAPNPEERLLLLQRGRRARSVFRALPERDRRCVLLRAAGLRYREIAAALGMSLGSVAKSLTQSLTRFVNADRR